MRAFVLFALSVVAAADARAQENDWQTYAESYYGHVYGQLIYYHPLEDVASMAPDGTIIKKPIGQYTRQDIAGIEAPGIIANMTPIFHEPKEQEVNLRYVMGSEISPYVNLVRAADDHYEGFDRRIVQRLRYTVLVRDAKDRRLDLTQWKSYTCEDTVIPMQGEKKYSLYMAELPTDQCPEPPAFTQAELQEAIQAEFTRQKATYDDPKWMPEHAARMKAFLDTQLQQWQATADKGVCRAHNCYALTSIELDIQGLESESGLPAGMKPEWQTSQRIIFRPVQYPGAH